MKLILLHLNESIDSLYQRHAYEHSFDKSSFFKTIDT